MDLSSSKSLSRAEILAADDLKSTREPVDVSEWGGTGKVYVRVMTGAERDGFEGHFATSRYRNTRAFAAVCALCDENGVGLFGPNDVEAVGLKSGVVLDRVFDAFLRINKLRREDIEAAAKNSAASPGPVSS